MPWLQVETLEIDPEEQAEYEKSLRDEDTGEYKKDRKGAKNPPEAKPVTKTYEFGGELRLAGHGIGPGHGYGTLMIAPNGVRKIEVIEERPEDLDEPATVLSDSSGILGAIGGSPESFKEMIESTAAGNVGVIGASAVKSETTGGSSSKSGSKSSS